MDNFVTDPANQYNENKSSQLDTAHTEDQDLLCQDNQEDYQTSKEQVIPLDMDYKNQSLDQDLMTQNVQSKQIEELGGNQVINFDLMVGEQIKDYNNFDGADGSEKLPPMHESIDSNAISHDFKNVIVHNQEGPPLEELNVLIPSEKSEVAEINTPVINHIVEPMVDDEFQEFEDSTTITQEQTEQQPIPMQMLPKVIILDEGYQKQSLEQANIRQDQQQEQLDDNLDLDLIKPLKIQDLQDLHGFTNAAQFHPLVEIIDSDAISQNIIDISLLNKDDIQFQLNKHNSSDQDISNLKNSDNIVIFDSKQGRNIQPEQDDQTIISEDDQSNKHTILEKEITEQQQQQIKDEIITQIIDPMLDDEFEEFEDSTTITQEQTEQQQQKQSLDQANIIQDYQQNQLDDNLDLNLIKPLKIQDQQDLHGFTNAAQFHPLVETIDSDAISRNIIDISLLNKDDIQFQLNKHNSSDQDISNLKNSDNIVIFDSKQGLNIQPEQDDETIISEDDQSNKHTILEKEITEQQQQQIKDEIITQIQDPMLDDEFEEFEEAATITKEEYLQQEWPQQQPIINEKLDSEDEQDVDMDQQKQPQGQESIQNDQQKELLDNQVPVQHLKIPQQIQELEDLHGSDNSDKVPTFTETIESNAISYDNKDISILIQDETSCQLNQKHIIDEDVFCENQTINHTKIGEMEKEQQQIKNELNGQTVIPINEFTELMIDDEFEEFEESTTIKQEQFQSQGQTQQQQPILEQQLDVEDEFDEFEDFTEAETNITSDSNRIDQNTSCQPLCKAIDNENLYNLSAKSQDYIKEVFNKLQKKVLNPISNLKCDSRQLIKQKLCDQDLKYRNNMKGQLFSELLSTHDKNDDHFSNLSIWFNYSPRKYLMQQMDLKEFNLELLTITSPNKMAGVMTRESSTSKEIKDLKFSFIEAIQQDPLSQSSNLDTHTPKFENLKKSKIQTPISSNPTTPLMPIDPIKLTKPAIQIESVTPLEQFLNDLPDYSFLFENRQRVK